jgi:hypothetical protein
MQFVLSGFTHDLGFRVFEFERVGDDRVRTSCTVRADLALARGFGIQIQELPLLCRSLLDRREVSGETGSAIFTEEDMRTYSTERAAARELAAHKRRPPQRPAVVVEAPGSEWRNQHP